MKTEEGQLKDKIKKWLTERGAYFFMPVQTGYGKQSLDFLCCLNGKFLGIETKAPGKKPTLRQEQCINEIIAASGVAFWCDSFPHFIVLMYQTKFIASEEDYLRQIALENLLQPVQPRRRSQS